MKYQEYLRNYGRRAGLVLLSVLLGACLATGCKKKDPDKIDISSIHTTGAETMPAETTKAAPPQTEASSTESSAAGAGSQNVKNVSAKLNTYSSGKVSIEYPSVVNLEDPDKAAALDSLMQNNALSIIQAYGLNEAEDSLNIKCKVLSADRNRITVTYTGEVARKDSAHPTAVFYTNTIDVGQGKDLGFEKFADPYTMAGYVLSGDCRFVDASDERKEELMKYKNENSLDYYTKLFSGADFPFEGTFPESFSYEQDGDIYFSIPVPHALGDYAVIVYVPDNK